MWCSSGMRGQLGPYIVETKESFVADCLAEAIEWTLEDRVVQWLSLKADLDCVERELDKLASYTCQLFLKCNKRKTVSKRKVCASAAGIGSSSDGSLGLLTEPKARSLRDCSFFSEITTFDSWAEAARSVSFASGKGL